MLAKLAIYVATNTDREKFRPSWMKDVDLSQADLPSLSNQDIIDFIEGIK